MYADVSNSAIWHDRTVNMCKHLNTKKITLWRNARMAAHLLMCHQFQQLLHPDASVVPLVQQWLLQEDYYPYHHLHRSPLLQPLPFAACTAQHSLPAGRSAQRRSCNKMEHLKHQSRHIESCRSLLYASHVR
jgi:hypothetical protein